MFKKIKSIFNQSLVWVVIITIFLILVYIMNALGTSILESLGISEENLRYLIIIGFAFFAYREIDNKINLKIRNLSNRISNLEKRLDDVDFSLRKDIGDIESKITDINSEIKWINIFLEQRGKK